MRGDEIEIGLHECTSFLHEAWARESKAFVDEVVVDTAGYAQAVVCGGQNFNKGEPCRPEHKGFVARAQGISHEAHWIGL